MMEKIKIIKKNKSLQITMLERVWRKGNPPTLLVGMQIGAATMENRIEVPKIELPYDPVIPLLGIYPDKIIV